MARPLKNGLDYFPFDTDFFSDPKIKRLRAKYGLKGITVYIYSLCLIYKNGYQIPYDDDLILDISEELRLTEGATREIVDYLLSRRLFEPELAKSVKVLTSKSIQSRWQAAKRGGNRRIEVEGGTWLLEPEKTYTFLEVHPSENRSPENPSFSGINGSKSPENDTKKRKEKKRKVFLSDTAATSNQESEAEPDMEAFPPSLDDVIAVAKQAVSEEAAKRIAKKFWEYYNGTGWVTKNGVPIRDWQNTLAHWLETERESKPKESKKAKGTIYDEFIYNE